MRTHLILLTLALGLAKAAAAFNPVPILLTTGWTNSRPDGTTEVFAWTNACYFTNDYWIDGIYQTNSVAPTNFETWQAFWGIRENFNLVSNEFATVQADITALQAGTNGATTGLTITQNVVLWTGTPTNLLAYTNVYANGLLVASGPSAGQSHAPSLLLPGGGYLLQPNGGSLLLP